MSSSYSFATCHIWKFIYIYLYIGYGISTYQTFCLWEKFLSPICSINLQLFIYFFLPRAHVSPSYLDFIIHISIFFYIYTIYKTFSTCVTLLSICHVSHLEVYIYIYIYIFIISYIIFLIIKYINNINILFIYK